MPFYEYQCSSCQHHTEALQKITDKPLLSCPACGKRALQRLVSAPVFRLKGSGWYETDFKSDKDKQRNLVGTDPEPKVDAKAETKPDAKPETKADAKSDAKPEAKADGKAEPTGGSKTAAKSGEASGKPTAGKHRSAPLRRHK